MRKLSIVLPITLALFLLGWMPALLSDAYAAPVNQQRLGAPQQQATPAPEPEADDASPDDTAESAESTSPAASAALTTTDTLTATAPITAGTAISPALPSLAPTPSPESDAETEAAANAETPSSTVVAEGVLEGTIVANRTDATIRFFVEGQLFTLDQRRSIGLDLPRASAVLNLFNCDAGTPETQDGCYWDPYLLQRDAFYEIVTGAEGGEAVNLMLREAGSPQADQIWIQNRTGKIETVVYRSETFELAPASVHEFVVDADEMPTFFLRSCVEAGGDIACEWLPVVAESGVYYSLALIETVGGLPNSTVSMLELQPVLAGSVAEVIETPPQFLCSLLVPALNVRSGPGLEYEIVAKIRGTEAEPATVLVQGRNTTGDWLAVDERVANGGWITSSASFIACDGDLNSLPESEVTDGRLAPTPVPVAQPAPADETAAADGATGDTTSGDDTTADGDAAGDGGAGGGADGQNGAQITEPPDGLALLVINNAFDHELRFTLDARYRVEPAPSEVDLEPGESTSIVIYPDFIPFSVSSAWNSMSGNADFYMEPNETRTLWLIFIPDPDGSGRWILQY